MDTLTKKQIADLSDKDLEKQWDAAAKEALSAKEYAKQLGAEVERRQTARAAEEQVSNMTPAQRDALAQAVKTVGIDTEETVNG